MDSSIGLRRTTLRQLDPDTSNALIIGIIIAKQRPRRINNANENKGVWNFTIRDSPRDYINATFWGFGDFILKLSESFHVGDIVAISKPRITIRNVDAHGEQFRPMVTSPYSLVLYDNQSTINTHDSGSLNNFQRLLSLPTKPLAGFVTLSDIQNSGSGRVGYFVDILVAVKSIGALRSIKTKQGIEQQVRDFIVLDRTLTSGARIAIWDPDLMIRAGFWTPRSTILFMTDLKIEYSHFHKTFLPSISSRTVITENPAGPEAQALKEYALTAPIQPAEILERLSNAIQDTNGIKNVMSIKQLLDKTEALTNPIRDTSTTDTHFTALLYVFVTHLDLDGLSRVVSTRCSHCKTLLSLKDQTCENLECTLGDLPELDNTFDLRVNLSDHTGSLVNCRLTGEIAERVLNCKVGQFTGMTDTEKCHLKWKYLMERCAIRILALCVYGTNPLYSILSCELASPIDVANQLPHY